MCNRPNGTGRKLQTNLDEFVDELLEDREIPSYGATIETKLENILRVAFQNINGINTNTINTGDEEIESMEQLGIDLFGID